MTIQLPSDSRPDHLTDDAWAMTPTPQETSALRQLSVRELIAELAQLEQASRSTAPLFSSVADDGGWPRTREGRIIAELRRRHAELRRWGFAGGPP
ncbi:MAG: hypothetical protein L0H96_25450 [Humibacillus sp.]|nr:hypothetical protein [Humibacillus sp.]